MKFRANKMLGLAIGERSILVAEVSTSADGCQVTRAGAFGYSDGTTLQDPQALGAALGEFLKAEGFTAKAAVFGIPAKWVLTKSKDTPPIDPSLACDMLRLQVESEFSAEIKDLVYDYAGQTSATEPSQVLLAATPKRHVELVQTIATAGKLDVQGIAPTSVVLGAATTRGTSDALVLSITPSGTELAAQRGANPSLLRHVGSTAGVTANVAGEVRRASLLLPRNGTSAGNGTTGNGSANGHSHGQIVVWDDAMLAPAVRRAAMDALGPAARSGEFSSLRAGDLPAGIPGSAAAVALAVAGASDEKLTIDFLHPRLAEPKKAMLQRRTVLALGAGAAVLILAIFAWVDLQGRERLRSDKLDELERTKVVRKDAEAEVKKIEFARNWHAGQPRYLDCLRDLTQDFPADGQIFVTSFKLHDTMDGDFGGKSTAPTSKNVRDLADRLQKDKRFQEVNLHSETRLGKEISFSITFKYVPLKPAQP